MSGTADWITAIATAAIAIEGAGVLVVWIRKMADPGTVDEGTELGEIIDDAILAADKNHKRKSRAAREVKQSRRQLTIRQRWQRRLRKRSREREARSRREIPSHDAKQDANQPS